MREETIARIEQCKITAIIRNVRGERLVPLAKALIAGGIDCMEIAFDPSGRISDSDTAAMLDMLRTSLGDRIVLGAGTCLDTEKVELAKSVGVDFTVSPDVNVEVIDKTLELEMVSMPGAFTPTEIQTACRYGADFVKLFPANFCGTEYIQLMKAPLPHAKLVAVGGVNVWNLRAFLDAGCVGACIGRSLIGEAVKEKCNFGIVTETAALFRSIADNDRK